MTFSLLPCLFTSSKSARFCLNHFCREPGRGKQRSFSIMATGFLLLFLHKYYLSKCFDRPKMFRPSEYMNLLSNPSPLTKNKI